MPPKKKPPTKPTKKSLAAELDAVADAPAPSPSLLVDAAEQWKDSGGMTAAEAAAAANTAMAIVW